MASDGGLWWRYALAALSGFAVLLAVGLVLRADRPTLVVAAVVGLVLVVLGGLAAARRARRTGRARRVRHMSR